MLRIPVFREIFLFIYPCVVILLSTCTTIVFDDNNTGEIPVAEFEKEKDTITVNDVYVPQYTLSDNKDSEQELQENVFIWIKDNSGRLCNLETFAENPGFYTVYLKVTDSDGNISEIVSCEIMVSERDNTEPIITLLGPSPYKMNLGETYHEPGAKAVDNFNGDVTDRIVMSGEVFVHNEGDYPLTYTVTDDAGNTGTTVRIVTVQGSNNDTDHVKPEITILGDNPYILYTGNTYSDPGAVAVDNVDGDITSYIQVFGTQINSSVNDSHVVYYTVEDNAGNVAIAKRIVVVRPFEDKTPPVITLLGDNPLYQDKGEQYNEPGATAWDDVDGDLSLYISIDNSEIDISNDGAYHVYYLVSDSAGNEGTKERIVVVGMIDTFPPIIHLVGDNPLEADIYTAFVDPGAFALDSTDENSFDTIPWDDFTTVDDINVNTFGTYTVSYTVSDIYGNETSAERTVIVTDLSPPVITLKGPNPVNLQVFYPYTEFGIESAIDNYDGDVSDLVTTSGFVNTDEVGIYIVSYKATDAHGNEGICERVVNVMVDTGITYIDTLFLGMRTLTKKEGAWRDDTIKVGGGARGGSEEDSYEITIYNTLLSLIDREILAATLRMNISLITPLASGLTATLYAQDKGVYSPSITYDNFPNTAWTESIATVTATDTGWYEISPVTLKDLIQDWVDEIKPINGFVLGASFGDGEAYWVISDAKLIVTNKFRSQGANKKWLENSTYFQKHVTVSKCRNYGGK